MRAMPASERSSSRQFIASYNSETSSSVLSQAHPIGAECSARPYRQDAFRPQVDLRSGIYEPTIPPRPKFGNLECWPDAPLWDQIENSESFSGRTWSLTGVIRKFSEGTLRQGVEFDDVVLAIPIGAFKP